MSRPLYRTVILLATWTLVSCTGRDVGEGTAMQNGFSWVVDQQLAGMPRPGSAADLDDDVEFLAEQGIDLLVSLTTETLDSSVLTEFGIESLHLPIADFQPPTLEQQVEFVARASQQLSNGGRVGVHCTAGMGRSGTILATYLVYLGQDADAAIDRVRELRPGSIETKEQEDAIRAYHAYLMRKKTR